MRWPLKKKKVAAYEDRDPFCFANILVYATTFPMVGIYGNASTLLSMYLCAVP